MQMLHGTRNFSMKTKILCQLIATCLPSCCRKPQIDDDERELEKNPCAVNGEERNVFPFVAYNWESIPSVKETVEQRSDVRYTRKPLCAFLPYDSRHSQSAGNTNSIISYDI